MGIEQTINKMDPKLKKLFNNIISILMIVILVSGVLLIGEAYIRTGNYMVIFNASILVPIILPFLFLFLAHSILSGKKIKIPNDLKKKEGQKTQFNIPNVYGVKNINKKEPVKQEKTKRPYGTWICKDCGNIAKGIECKNCGKRI